ncbi:uncharacterized protein ARMOST_02315 [Armillaria ostoyae]|uniref:Uncharacterized protein n=1 Tax=Armillaria ostoyae TaxID=47428 RepID=A0A284QRJ5_ARMOS|nr:uncharacterized protein ARMOST_02315 [Armillaria ostoyae]
MCTVSVLRWIRTVNTDTGPYREHLHRHKIRPYSYGWNTVIEGLAGGNVIPLKYSLSSPNGPYTDNGTDTFTRRIVVEYVGRDHSDQDPARDVLNFNSLDHLEPIFEDNSGDTGNTRHKLRSVYSTTNCTLVRSNPPASEYRMYAVSEETTFNENECTVGAPHYLSHLPVAFSLY